LVLKEAARPRRQQRNPVILAEEWQQRIVGGEVRSRADLARKLGVSRARVTQALALEWTCTSNTNPIWPGSKLIWQIEPAPNGSVVHCRHEGFSDGGPAYDCTVEGWQLFMDSLQAYLDGGTAHPSD
jgi:hypothetical protein